jgi:hypothetical protein
MRKAEANSGTPSLAEVVNRAVEVCDPTGTSDAAADFEERFEDRDEPVTAVPDVEEELLEGRGAIDPQDEDPTVAMTVAVATYLAYRRTELDRDPLHLLGMAARAEFDGDPPPHVAEWLADQGVAA